MDIQLQVTDRELEEFPEDKFDHTSLGNTNKVDIRADIVPPTADLSIPTFDLPISTTDIPAPQTGLPKLIDKQRHKVCSKTTNSWKTPNQ